MPRALSLLAFALVMLVVPLTLTEGALRWMAPQGWFVWPPGMHAIFRPLPGAMPGVEGESRFTINAEGLRGELLSGPWKRRILALGGSSTECLYLDDTEAWPAVLQQRLNDEPASEPVCVANGGKSGHDTRHHVMQVERLLEQHADVDVVLLMIGINDLLKRLSRDEQWTPLPPAEAQRDAGLVAETFWVHPPQGDAPWWQRTEIGRRLRGPDPRLAGVPDADNPMVQDERGKGMLKLREWRRNTPDWRETLPDLDAALADYGRNLRAIIEASRERGVRPVLVTQPVLWRDDLPESLSALTWTGGIGVFQARAGHAYYTVDALAEGMQRYNAELLRVCADTGADCFDLAAVLPQDTSIFYDDCHFNEAGARAVADALAGFLLEDVLR